VNRTRADQRPSFTRKSIAYARSRDRISRDDPWLSLYGHTFIEDVRLYVMPIGGESRARPDFSIELVPDSPVARSIITYAFAPRDYYHYYSGVTKAISGFIQENAFTLAYEGVLYYEIAKGEWPAGAVEPRGIENGSCFKEAFKPLYIPGRVIRLANYYLQIVPPAEWARTGKKIAAIPASDVWLLRIPSELGGPRKHRTLLKTLVRASTPLPDFVSEALNGLSEIRDFSLGSFHRQQHLAVASESASWGWPARALWRESTLEYFYYHRHLRFALSMAILREHIIDSINSLLERVDFPSRLVLKGLPTPSEIKGYIEKLEKGEMTFDDAWKAVEI
jgi:hypothetical protein